MANEHSQSYFQPHPTPTVCVDAKPPDCIPSVIILTVSSTTASDSEPFCNGRKIFRFRHEFNVGIHTLWFKRLARVRAIKGLKSPSFYGTRLLQRPRTSDGRFHTNIPFILQMEESNRGDAVHGKLTLTFCGASARYMRQMPGPRFPMVCRSLRVRVGVIVLLLISRSAIWPLALVPMAIMRNGRMLSHDDCFRSNLNVCKQAGRRM